MDLQAPVQFVKGIGPQKAEALGRVGVVSAEDLLLHLPMRYEDRRSFARVADLRPGMRVSVAGEIVVAGLRRARRMAIYEVRLDDGSGRLKAVFFNQPYLRETLPRGKKVVWGFDDDERKLLTVATDELPDLRAVVARARCEPEVEGVFLVEATVDELDQTC